MKQTAVEWLVERLEKHHTNIDIKNTIAFQQAKEMEKEQKIEFAEQMRLIQDVDFDGNVTFAFDPRTHLETFKSKQDESND
jgi:hypothetical protein